MSKTTIEWCIRPGTLPETWNPTTGCNKVSQGCKNCYAEIMHRRLQSMYPQKYNHDFLTGAHEHPETLSIPLKWKKPRTVFVNSMSDLFHENVSFEFINKCLAVMTCQADQHTYIILTKRPRRILEYMDWFKKSNINPNWERFGDNIWFGTSVEDQKSAEERIPLLIEIPASVRFLSCEPLLGPVNIGKDKLSFSKDFIRDTQIHWVIAGGESGHHARPMHPDWARSLRDQCNAAGIPFFFKQWGEWAPVKTKTEFHPLGKYYWISENGVITKASGAGFNDQDETVHHELVVKYGKHYSGRLLDGKEHNEFPHSHTSTFSN